MFHAPNALIMHESSSVADSGAPRRRGRRSFGRVVSTRLLGTSLWLIMTVYDYTEDDFADLTTAVVGWLMTVPSASVTRKIRLSNPLLPWRMSLRYFIPARKN